MRDSKFDIEGAYHSVRDNIKSLCLKLGRNPSDVALIAVSKTQPAESVRRLVKSVSHLDFGESYVQELIVKHHMLSDLPIRWHFIGHLQTNKISKLVKLASEIQSIENEKHVRYIARYAEEYAKVPYPVYISLNCSGEEQKSGVSYEDAALLRQIICDHYPQLSLQGIMTVPPFSFQDPEDGNYSSIPDLYKKISDFSKNIGLGKLSIGMSGDMGLAIASGSTCLRIGTAIFGER